MITTTAASGSGAHPVQHFVPLWVVLLSILVLQALVIGLGWHVLS